MTNKDLNQLKGIEEKLGIDLITLLNVLTQGYVFWKHDNFIYKVQVESITKYYLKGWYYSDFNKSIRPSDYKKIMIDFADYGKTWALNEEELEAMNDKAINNFKETYVIYVQLEDNQVYALALDIMIKYKYKIVNNFLYKKHKKIGKIVKFLEKEKQ